MQWSTDVRQIKTAIWNQAFIGRAYGTCPMGRVVAKRREEGAALGDDLWLGALVQRGGCAHCCWCSTSNNEHTSLKRRLA